MQLSFISNISCQHAVQQLSKAKEDHNQKLVEMMTQLQENVKDLNDKLNALSSKLEKNKGTREHGETCLM